MLILLTACSADSPQLGPQVEAKAVLNHRTELAPPDDDKAQAFGIYVTGPGDLDADGYDDVVVSDYHYSLVYSSAEPEPEDSQDDSEPEPRDTGGASQGDCGCAAGAPASWSLGLLLLALVRRRR
jgi:uncharacterized protein (TIGR03382 family)